MTYTESFTGYPTFDIINSGNGDSIIIYNIVYPTHSGYQYSRIYQTDNIIDSATIVAQPISGSTYVISGLSNNTYYYFAMDSVVEVSGSVYNFYKYNFGVYNGNQGVEDGPLSGFKKVLVSDSSAGGEMQLPRLSKLSLVYFLRDTFEANGWYPDNLTIIDGYPEDKRNLVSPKDFTDSAKQRKMPVMTVDLVGINPGPLELGSRDSYAKYMFSVDVFAEKDGQKDDILYIAKKALADIRFNILDYNQGFPPVTGQTILAIADVTSVKQHNTSNKNSDVIADRHAGRLVLTVEVIEEY